MPRKRWPKAKGGEDVNNTVGEHERVHQGPQELDRLIYGYIAAMARLRNLFMGADVGRYALIELRLEGG